jgi:hypothetical protein
MMRTAVIAAVLAASPAYAFVQQQQHRGPSFVGLRAASSENHDNTVVNRRDALGLAALMGAAFMTTTVAASPASAASNPALETFKSKVKANSFYPGKGMRLREQEMLLSSNPALETFKGRKRTKGSFQPGKGIRQHDENDDSVLMAASNPALETFKGKAKANSFYPGKGMRLREQDLLASNPALETLRGRKKTKGSFQPGKGIRRQHLDVDDMFMAASNPALETFKGKAKANSFYPGKGMRLRSDGSGDFLA